MRLPRIIRTLLISNLPSSYNREVTFWFEHDGYTYQGFCSDEHIAGDPHERLPLDQFLNTMFEEACDSQHLAQAGSTFEQFEEYVLGRVKFPLEGGSIHDNLDCNRVLDAFYDYQYEGEGEESNNNPCSVSISHQGDTEIQIAVDKVGYETLHVTAADAIIEGKFVRSMRLSMIDVQSVLDQAIAACEYDLVAPWPNTEYWDSGEVHLRIIRYPQPVPGFNNRSLRDLFVQLRAYHQSRTLWVPTSGDILLTAGGQIQYPGYYWVGFEGSGRIAIVRS